MILVSGSIAYDHIMDFPGAFSEHILPDKLHILNVSFLVPTMVKGFGGSGANIAYTLALLGMKPVLLGVVGKDFTAYETFLKKVGVDTSLLVKDQDRYCSTAFGITDRDDNQIWGFYPGVDELSDQLSLPSTLSPKPFSIIAPHNPKAMLKFAREYRELGISYLFDPGMQLRWFTGGDLKGAFEGAGIIIGNDYEVIMMQKMTGIADLHKKYGKDKIVITTLGADGSTITWKGKTLHAKAARVTKAVDPSGAGDAFRAGFVAGFLAKKPIKVCAQIGSVAAAYTVEKYGTTTHRFTPEEFARRYKKYFHELLDWKEV